MGTLRNVLKKRPKERLESLEHPDRVRVTPALKFLREVHPWEPSGRIGQP
ncbi:MAG: hypothetical protein F6K39_19995 [Okeania sp. SIO3B3]|nr:hypothetical protein [Okeania sp. SIO3B3]